MNKTNISYTRIATKEEISNFTEEEIDILKEKFSSSIPQTDPVTFQPYLVADNVRYNIEPVKKDEQ